MASVRTNDSPLGPPTPLDSPRAARNCFGASFEDVQAGRGPQIDIQADPLRDSRLPGQRPEQIYQRNHSRDQAGGSAQRYQSAEG